MIHSEIIPPGFDKGILLETRKGNRVPTFSRLPASPHILQAGDDHLRKIFGGIQTRSLDSRYNCVGMVFAFRRAWIDTIQVAEMLSDDEYHEVARGQATPGDLIAYYKDAARHELTHIGIIMAKERQIIDGDWNIMVLSKWGADGEYLHLETTVPQVFGTTRAYYSEKKCL